MDTHNLFVDFGKHKGERWTRVPVSYLKWCINEFPISDNAHKTAKAELLRRGDTMPTDVNISNHAIDNASLRVLECWIDDRNKDEGLYSWLVRICTEALKRASDDRPERVRYKDCVLIFAYGNHFPTLKTVINNAEKRARKQNANSRTNERKNY